MSPKKQSKELKKAMQPIDKSSIEGSVMLEQREIADGELDIMKGDTVGDTVYSAKWILNTLISLSKKDETRWTEQLENNLCMLWDMTAEKDVVTYLMENGFLSIAEYTLNTSNEPRLTEIILGIISNMCCQTSVLETIGNNKDFVGRILDLLTSDDTESLIQILRLLQTALWNIQTNVNSVWLNNLTECTFLGDTLIFILKSSTNDGLLIATTDLLQLASEIQLADATFLEKILKIEDLVPALLESFTQVVTEKDTGHSETDLKMIENWLAIMSSLMKRELLIFEESENDENLVKTMDVLSRILQPYKNPYNLITMDEKSASSVQESVQMALLFQRNEICITTKINCATATIAFRLREISDENTDNNVQSEFADELLKYLEEYWVEIIEYYSTEQILEVFRMCDKDVVNNIANFVSSYPDVPAAKIDKVMEAKSIYDM